MDGAIIKKLEGTMPRSIPLAHLACLPRNARAHFLLKVETMSGLIRPNGNQYKDESIVELLCSDPNGDAVQVSIWGGHNAVSYIHFHLHSFIYFNTNTNIVILTDCAKVRGCFG